MALGARGGLAANATGGPTPGIGHSGIVDGVFRSGIDGLEGRHWPAVPVGT